MKDNIAAEMILEELSVFRRVLTAVRRAGVKESLPAMGTEIDKLISEYEEKLSPRS